MAQNQGLPSPALPMVDNEGKINPVWFQFLNSLFQRTGGSSNTGNVQSIAIQGGNGITVNTVNPTSNAQIQLGLGDITPQSVASQGAVSGTTGDFPTGLSTLGQMQFGSFVNASISQTGYVTIIDVNGIPRQLMIGS